MADNNFAKAVRQAGSGDKFPSVSLVRENPALAAALSKLVTPVTPPSYNRSGEREPAQPNTFEFRSRGEQIAQKIADAKTVMQVLPDVELAKQILVSSILSPKDMVTTELTYKISDGLMSPEISAALIGVVKKTFEQEYKIKPLLSTMLGDILFETGSYPVAVIPENTIDDVINSNSAITMESFGGEIDRNGRIINKGILGPVSETKPRPYSNSVFSLESYDYSPTGYDVNPDVDFEHEFKAKQETFLSVTDNPSVLKLPYLHAKVREKQIRKIVGSRAMESISLDNVSDRTMVDKIYQNKQFSYKTIATLKTQEQLSRKSVGSPLVVHLPSESVIPVFVPGCPEQHIGFFILLDMDGNPISRSDDVDYYQQLSNRLNSNGNFASAMLNRVKSQMQGFSIMDRNHLDFMVHTYSDMVEKDLLARLRNGLYGKGLSLTKNSEIYRIMLARALSKQHTQLLFIPAEMMDYIAFKYTSDGIGQSLLDDTRILNSLRSMLLFANTMAAIRNSVGRTNVEIKLDETDPNPQKTIEEIQHEIIRTRQQNFPLGVNAPTDQIDWMQKSAFEFTFSGHPSFPDTSIAFNEKQSNYQKPDTELEESLRKRAIMSYGLSPETVDASFNAEFATSVVSNNILLAKRVTTTQEKFLPQLSNHLRKFLMNSETVVNEMRDILTNNFEKLKKDLAYIEGVDAAKAAEGKTYNEADKTMIVNIFLNEFIMNFEAHLPAPNSVTLENQLTAMDTYSKGLDQAIEAIISEKFFTSDINGQAANQIATAKEVVRSYFMRKWMSDNGVMSELSQLVIKDRDGKPIIDVFKMQEEHIESLTLSLTSYVADLLPVKNAANKVFDKLETSSTETPSSTGGGSDGGSSFDEFSFDDSGPKLDEEPSAVTGTGAPEEQSTQTTETSTATGETKPAESESSTTGEGKPKEANLNGEVEE